MLWRAETKCRPWHKTRLCCNRLPTLLFGANVQQVRHP
jgi:hypothetical protein